MKVLSIDAHDVRARVKELPALPRAVHEIVRALNDDDLDLEAIAAKIAVDPALASRLLRAANSPFYGASRTIGGIPDAVRLIGVRTAGTIVSAASIVSVVAVPPSAIFDFQRYWGHSLATGICSQELARECGHSMTTAFVAGLLHDIGQAVLAAYYPQQFSAAVRCAKARDCPMYEAENDALGLNHTEVGAWIAAHWHFADSVSDAIRWHHDPHSESANGPMTLADIVHTADGIVHALDLFGATDEKVPLLQLGAWQRLQIGPEVFPRLFERIVHSFEAMHATLF